MKRKIYDCTTFHKANLLFETRFNILKDYVDYFVVCEANKDHIGNPKDFNFNKKLLDKYSDKIIYIKVEDLPKIKLKGKKDYGLLKIQMENLFKGIKFANDEASYIKIITNWVPPIKSEIKKMSNNLFANNNYNRIKRFLNETMRL